MRKTRLNILAQATTCENCGEYVASCTCQNQVQMCGSCGEHAIDCPCDEAFIPFMLNPKLLRQALI